MTEIKRFAKLSMPDLWLDAAQELKDAADVLMEDIKKSKWGMHVAYIRDEVIAKPRSSKGYILLAGFAVENLIKGIMVIQDSGHINEGKLSSILKTHNLLKLYSKINKFKLTSNQVKTLEILSNGLVYWSRYPIPLSASQIQDEVILTPRLARSIEGIYLKLHRFFYQEINKGWDSGFSDLNISNIYMADYGDDVKKIVSDAKAKSKD